MRSPLSAITLLTLLAALTQTAMSIPSAAKKYEQFELTISSVEEGLIRPKNLECGCAYEVWIRRTGAPANGHTTSECGKMVDYLQGLTSDHNAVNLWIVCPDNAPVANKGTRPTKFAFSYYTGQGVNLNILDVEQQPSGILRIDHQKTGHVVDVPVKLGAAVRLEKGSKMNVLVSYMYCT